MPTFSRFALIIVLMLLAGCASTSQLDLSPTATLPTTPEPPAPVVAVPTGIVDTAIPPAVPTTVTPTTFSAPPTSTSAPATATSIPTPSPVASPTPQAPAPLPVLYSYPIGTPGAPPGDGFVIRHGVAVENTWYNPGYWHTGEDWYALEGDTGGALVYAVADGEVVYAGANYPGRVVIVRHTDGLYAMYGHLDPALAVAEGDDVIRGQVLGTVLLQTNSRAPSHLHFEIRTFLLNREVNGDAPRYTFRCGVNCPPGPGYWPISAPDLPGDLGWYNPTHVIARRMAPDATTAPLGAVVVATRPFSTSVTLWSAPPGPTTAVPLATLELRPGERFTLLDIAAGEEAALQTSATAYLLWYRIQLPDGRDGWVHAAVPSNRDTGSDGRPASLEFNFFPIPAI